MKKILFIDVYCPNGHINLNKNFINQFNSLGYELDFVLKKGYNDDIGIDNNSVIWSVPNSFYNESAGSVLSRANIFAMLLLLRFKVDTRNYDYLFFSCYEEMSLLLSGLRGNFILVNHANISGLENPVKRFFVRKVAKYSINIVFGDFIKRAAERYGLKNVKVQQIGLSNSYSMNLQQQQRLLYGISPKLIDKAFNTIIFIPTGQKYGDSFVKEILENTNFKKFLKREKILLVIKDKNIKSCNENILVINSYMSNEEYKSLFLISTLILLSYPKSFKYRISAVLFESFSCEKACLLSEIEGFTSYRYHFNYDPYYSDIETLISSIEKYLFFKKTPHNEPYRNLSSLNQNFETIFSAEL